MDTGDPFDPENDFKPLLKTVHGHKMPLDRRIASAAEYSAFQLGQIKVQLRRIADALERKRQPD